MFDSLQNHIQVDIIEIETSRILIIVIQQICSINNFRVRKTVSSLCRNLCIQPDIKTHKYKRTVFRAFESW
jgi:hypothetical protein